jgi:MOSC domain-containing protein YiiM
VTESSVRHLSAPELEAALPQLREAPRGRGRIELVVRRPREGAREVLAEAQLDLDEGLVGDRWVLGRSRGRAADPQAQLTLMSARVADVVAAGERERWPLAGDQLFVDLDLSEEHLPAGTRLAVGEAVLELTPPPHTGCKKFVQRFGDAAMRFVNSPEGRALRLRGANARVVEPGVVRPGDEIRVL